MKTIVLEVNKKDKTVREFASFQRPFLASEACYSLNESAVEPFGYGWSKKDIYSYATSYGLLVID